MKLCDQEGIWKTQLKSIHYSLNYSLAACSQDNSHPKLPTKVETQRKLQQFTVSGWLIMNGGESSSEKKGNFKVHMHRNF